MLLQFCGHRLCCWELNLALPLGCAEFLSKALVVGRSRRVPHPRSSDIQEYPEIFQEEALQLSSFCTWKLQTGHNHHDGLTVQSAGQ
eukprot:s1469_g4.t1